MGRRGRPRKHLDQIEVEKLDLSDDIVSAVKFNGNLSEEQTRLLRNTLDNALKGYTINKKREVTPEGMSIKDINNEVLDSFIKAKQVEGRSTSTVYNYSNEIGKLFMVVNKDYRDITAQDIRNYMEYRREHDKIKLSSVQNIRLYLMSFYKFCIADERVTRNPMDKIGTVRVEKKVIETFTDEEVEKLRCACTSERDLAIIDMLSSSGMRVSELTGLNRDDVNFETGEVKVFGKGKKERICFLTGRARIHLKWYLSSRTDNNPALFVTAKKPYERMTKNGVEYLINVIGKRSGISLKSRCYPHKFRATLATNMLNKGADIGTIQAVLGHASPETTVQCYARMDNSTIHQAHNKYVG